MKLVIQIPCLNEESTLAKTIDDLPRHIPGVDEIALLIVDDGSTDKTFEVAKRYGADRIVRHQSNLGLAAAFRSGIDAALKMGADIIVNTDADNQYHGADIAALVAPIVAGRAGMVVGERNIEAIADFSPLKRFLQKLGSLVIRKLGGAKVADATSGFRAFSREAALKFTVLGSYTYTHELLLQAKLKGITVESVPIKVNAVERPSRLMRSMRSYLGNSAVGILRIFTLYNPLRVFGESGILIVLAGSALVARFFYFYFTVGESGKVQSLVVGSGMVLAGLLLILVGVLADLIQFNRKLSEDILERVKRLEIASVAKDESQHTTTP